MRFVVVVNLMHSEHWELRRYGGDRSCFFHDGLRPQLERFKSWGVVGSQMKACLLTCLMIDAKPLLGNSTETMG